MKRIEQINLAQLMRHAKDREVTRSNARVIEFSDGSFAVIRPYLDGFGESDVTPPDLDADAEVSIYLCRSRETAELCIRELKQLDVDWELKMPE